MAARHPSGVSLSLGLAGELLALNNASFQEQFLRTVAADLLYIQKKWGPDVDEDSLRRDCIVLRRLLIENDLVRAWQMVGFVKQPRILAGRLDVGSDKESLGFAQIGGGLSGKVGEGIARVSNVQYLEKGDVRYYLRKQKKEPSPHTKEAVTLPKFLDSTCIIAEGNEVCRRDLILYVANTLGCAHTDLTRGFREKHRVKFEALDRVLVPKGMGLVVLGRNPVYYELLSIGQALADSKDIEKLKRRIHQAIGNEKRIGGSL